jgi:hypothetical protein
VCEREEGWRQIERERKRERWRERERERTSRLGRQEGVAAPSNV